MSSSNRDIEESAGPVEAIVAAERLKRTRQVGLADFVNRLRAGQRSSGVTTSPA